MIFLPGLWAVRRTGLTEVDQRPALFAAPAPLLRLAMGELVCLLLEGQKVLPGKMTAAGYRFQYPSLGEALGNLFGG